MFESPNGWLRIESSEDGITQISRSDAPVQNMIDIDNPFLEKCSLELSEYFSGTRKTFTVPLDLNGTEFQLRVWRSLARIPYGTTITYGDIARSSGRPKGYQAVGQIVGNNPIPIILPCHRVMGSSGNLTGFGLGIPWKIWLLRHENIEIDFL
ncbi:MAG TPA: methylated-DNA--[protein]-cysteine S-methyltransferase [Balneolales bacterium]|nr:methylated-DNA--[protein]-cysteine S-methyltransferase [Balneolales bacterium]